MLEEHYPTLLVEDDAGHSERELGLRQPRQAPLQPRQEGEREGMAGTFTNPLDHQDTAALSLALEAFLHGGSPVSPYVVTALGRYRALAVQRQPGAPESLLELLLLAGDDGTVYVPAEHAPEHEAAQFFVHETLLEALKRRRLRPTATSLALRLPDGASSAAPRLGHFTLWASPAYLAAGGEGGAVWK